MTEAVLDASVVLKWFHRAGEERADQARALRARFEAGELTVFAPPLLFLEIINVAARRWLWSQDALTQLAVQLEQTAFELQEPDLPALAKWVGRGLTAYDAAYVALAEALGIPLITDDNLMIETARGIASPLQQIGESPRP
jgi:predicted nucleic acid-binding protein